MQLDNAHVLITGGSRGIGAAMAEAFAAAGARVSVAARSADALAGVADPIGGTPFTVDLAEEDQTDALIGRVEQAEGPIDVLVNNAGIETTEFYHGLDPDAVRRINRINLEAPMVLTRHVLPGMLDRNRGHLVYTSSLAGTGGFPGLVAYGATKAGVTNFVAGLRMELRATEVGTTVVAPGPVDTQMWDAVDESDDTAPTVRRLRLLQLLPTKSPDFVAKQTVAAVESGRRHVRTPRRLGMNHWLREAPSRLTEAALTGVQTGPRP